MPKKPRSKYSPEQVETAVQQIQRSLTMLGRVKYGATNAESQIDGTGPVNEYFAMGAVRAMLTRALETLGVELEGPQP